MNPHAPRKDTPEEPWEAIAEALIGCLSRIPHSSEPESDRPSSRARRIGDSAAAKAGLAAGALALPPGPLGWLTLIPELLAIWKIQAQMVADIAGAYGKTAAMTREQMLYCLFRHTAAQALRDLVVRAGERLLIRQVSARAIQDVAAKIGIHLTRRCIGKGLARWIPLAGAAGVGAYAYFDTLQVAKTAIALFGREIEVEAEVTRLGPPPGK